MTRRSHSSPTALSLSLALLLSMACSDGSEGTTQESSAPASETSSAPPAPNQPAFQPGQPGAAPMPSQPPDTSKMPDVVARVNGQEVKKDELLRSAEMMRARYAQSTGGKQVPALNATFFKDVLDSIIAQMLIVQDATRQGVTVSDEELKPQMSQVRGQFPDQATYEKKLAEQGLTEKALQEKMREEAITQKYVGTKLLNNLAVTDAAAKEFYDNNLAQMQRPERVHLRHILVSVKPGTPEAEKQKAKSEAEDLLKRAQAGEDFAKLAAENSDDPTTKSRGGDLSWVARGKNVTPFEQAAFALTKPNELAVVESQFGYHVIQFLERQPASVVPFEEAKGQITQMLKQRQAGDTLKAHVENLKKQGKVEVFL